MDKCRIFPTGGYEGSPPPHPTNQKFAHPLSGKISPSGHPLTNQSLIPPLNNNFNVIIR